jgi:DNA-binding CsgD family transcriptional regulator/PAS domain-containing protein
MERARPVDDTEIIGVIYDAALGCRSWSEVTQGLLTQVEGQTLMMSTHHPKTGQVDILGWHGMSADSLQRYPRFAPHDLWASGYIERRLYGRAAIGSHVVEERQLERSFIYNEYLRQIGVYRLVGTVVPMDGGWHATLGLHRPRDGADFSLDEARRLERLLPHLQRALEVQRRLQQAEQVGRSVLSVLDRLSIGVIVLSASGRLVLANSAADTILRAADGLVRTPGGLHAAHKEDDRRLQALIGGLRRGLAEGCTAGGHLQLRRPSGQRAYSVMVAPGAPAMADGKGEPTILIFVSDPGEAIVSETTVLAELFGFPPAEARLVLSLLSGVALPEFARQAGVTHNTARTLLSRAMARTETRSQLELVLLVAASIGGTVTAGRPQAA